MTTPELPAPTAARHSVLVALAVAVVFALGWHLWVGDRHLNPAEEGYLWYGVWRTAEGEVPLRDFQSYDPGRYLACAALGEVFGPGITGLRRSLAAFHALGIFLGLLAARRVVRASWMLVPIGIVLGAWMFPRHKVFEGVAALASTLAAVRLLERPTIGRHLGAGAVAGLVAFFGRNLGLYSAVGLAVLAAVSAWKRRDRAWGRSALALAGGIVAGYAPMLVMLAFVPGFFDGFVRSLLLLLKLGANIESEGRWPWSLDFAGATAREAVASVALGLVYVLPFVVLPWGAWRLLRASGEELRARALLLAATVMGVLHLHHSSVRSDSSHLAQSIQPTLLAAVALAAAVVERRRAVGAVLAAGTGLTLLVAGIEWNPAHEPHLSGARFVPVRLGEHDELRMLRRHADYFERLQRVVGSHLRPGDRLFVAPGRPSFYPLFGRPSPTWWIYFFVPDADRATQEEIVADLEGVEWVLIVDHPIAGREELRFHVSHPLVWTYVTAAYERVPTPELEANHWLFRLRE